MKNTCLLSQDAKTYLCCFYQTLDSMIQGMTAAVLTQSISHNFAVQMVPHCRAAAQMSNNVLRFTQDKAVRRLAQRMAEDCALCAEQLEDVLPACAQLTNARTDLRLYQRRMDLIYREMYAKMGSSPESNRLAPVFLRQMIPLCQGAARMADTALKYDVSPQLVPLLRAIAARQRWDIPQMRALLGRTDCQRG